MSESLTSSIASGSGMGVAPTAPFTGWFSQNDQSVSKCLNFKVS